MGIGHINGVNGFELFFVGVTLLYHKNRAIYVHASYLFYFFFFFNYIAVVFICHPVRKVAFFVASFPTIETIMLKEE